jgi:hypothetical protein
MRSYMPWQARNHWDRKSSQRIAVCRQFLFTAASLVAWLAFSQLGAAQSSAPIGQTQPRVHLPNAMPSQPSPVPNSAALPVVQSPSEPKKPDWPMNAQARKAKVEWNSRGLYVAADNSSLKQILDDVSAATGVKLDGFIEDERVFGAYGPGAAREVLSKLLDGAGYNVLMSGDQGQGTPRQIVLSRRAGGSAQPSSMGSQSAAQNAPAMASQDAADDEEVVPEEPEPAEQAPTEPQPAAEPQQQQQQTQPQTPTRPVFGSGGIRTPQQIIQEMQERQQQLQQQQQQQQQNNSQ